MGRHRVQAHPGRAAAVRRDAGRPVRPEADLPDRCRMVRAGLAPVRTRPDRGGPDRGPCRAGSRRRVADAGQPGHIEATFRPADRGKAIGAWSGLSGVATAIGPFLGGWLVQAVSWRLIFVISLPVAGMVVAVSVRHLPESRDRGMTGRVDITGGILATPGWPGRSCHPPVSRQRPALMSLRSRSGHSRRVSARHRRNARSGGDPGVERFGCGHLVRPSCGLSDHSAVRPRYGKSARISAESGATPLPGAEVGPPGQHDIHDVTGSARPLNPGVAERGRGAEWQGSVSAPSWPGTAGRSSPDWRSCPPAA